MSVVLAICIGLILLVVLIDLILWSAWKPKGQQTAELTEELPFISILLAVRNEVHNVSQTLESIEEMDFPADKFEVLMGDDQSSDGSTDILKRWAEENPHFKYIAIEEGVGDMTAKANVLAQLEKHAKGDYLMFTDADISVPEAWVKKHLACLKDNTGIQSGFTIIRPTGFFSSMQMIDWSLALGMVKIVSGWNIPVTGVGNNMIVSRQAYDEVGGYSSLPFSVTEDFALFDAITKKGFGFQQLANSESLAKSKAESSFSELLIQRKRWMRGALKLPFFMIFLLILQALYYPAIIFLLLAHPLIGIPLFGLKTTLQSLFINKIHERLGEYMPLGHLFIFELYSAALSIVLCFYYLLPLPLSWKGRKI